MTLQQLRLVSTTASLGSISAAAHQLHISQPNASQSIKKLEEELGYALFRRNEGRTVPTEQGYLFLEHSDAILREDEAIRAITAYPDFPRLRVGVINYTPAFEAFFRFVKENQDKPFCDLTCITVLPEKGTELLRERDLDIIVTPQVKSAVPATQKLCKINRFSCTIHKEIPICVRVRADHPLILNGKLDGSLESFQYLKEFPYAEYKSMDYFTPMLHSNHVSAFGCSYKIYADERDTRLKIVQNSNAYNIGIYLPEWKLKQYGLKAFPISDEHILLCSYVRNGDDGLRDIRRYRELLMEESEWQILNNSGDTAIL